MKVVHFLQIAMKRDVSPSPAQLTIFTCLHGRLNECRSPYIYFFAVVVGPLPGRVGTDLTKGARPNILCFFFSPYAWTFDEFVR